MSQITEIENVTDIKRGNLFNFLQFLFPLLGKEQIKKILKCLPSFLNGEVILLVEDKELLYSYSFPYIFPKKHYERYFLDFLFDILFALWRAFFKGFYDLNKWQEIKKRLIQLEDPSKTCCYFLQKRKGFFVAHLRIGKIENKHTNLKDLDEVIKFITPQVEMREINIRFQFLKEGQEEKELDYFVIRKALYFEIDNAIRHRYKRNISDETLIKKRIDYLEQLQEEGLINKENLPLCPMDKIIHFISPKTNKYCDICGKPINGRKDKKYCSAKCRKKAERERKRKEKEIEDFYKKFNL